MKITSGAVVVFDYVLRDESGTEIDSGAGDEAMVYLHGHNQLVPGLERELEGKSEGDQFQAVVPPGEGYGEVGEEDSVRVPRDELPADLDLEVGAELQAESSDGTVETFWVADVDNREVVLSREHPLAGVTLHFDVTVRKVREATPEELAHGHPHEGEHDHSHDE